MVVPERGNRKDCFHRRVTVLPPYVSPRCWRVYNQRAPKIQFALTTGRLRRHARWRARKLNAAAIDILMHPGLPGIPVLPGRDDDRRATRPFRHFAGQRGEWL